VSYHFDTKNLENNYILSETVVQTSPEHDKYQLKQFLWQLI